MKWNKCRQEY